VLQNLKAPPAIPDEYVTDGLHIIYQYAYSGTLQMSRSDGKQFDTDVAGNIGNFIDVGAKAKVESKNNTVISFSNTNNELAAFAYKAGQLQKLTPKRWTFAPEKVKRSEKGEKSVLVTDSPRYLPSPGVVLAVEP
jgi:hypothetical protein